MSAEHKLALSQRLAVDSATVHLTLSPGHESLLDGVSGPLGALFIQPDQPGIDTIFKARISGLEVHTVVVEQVQPELELSGCRIGRLIVRGTHNHI